MWGLQVGLISTEHGVCLHHLTLWVIFICHPHIGGPTAGFFFFCSPGARVFSMSCLNMIAPAIFDHDIARNARLIPISVYNSQQWVVAMVHVRAQICYSAVAGRTFLFQRVQRSLPLKKQMLNSFIPHIFRHKSQSLGFSRLSRTALTGLEWKNIFSI